MGDPESAKTFPDIKQRYAVCVSKFDSKSANNRQMEYKNISLELKDLSKGKRTAVIAHAVYNVIDRVGDISTKGMFNSSWQRKDKVDFYFNHNEPIGTVLRTFEDDQKAYTESKFGDWTLANDVLEMADMGVLKGASFQYETEKKDYKVVNGQKVRVLKQVKHIETSLLTKPPANPLAGIVSLNKALELKYLSTNEQNAMKRILMSDQAAMEDLMAMANGQDQNSDIYTSTMDMIAQRANIMANLRGQLKYNSADVEEMMEYAKSLETFCSNSHASDECIIVCMNDLEEIKSLLDTVSTPLITDGDASVKEFADRLHLLTLKL